MRHHAKRDISESGIRLALAQLAPWVRHRVVNSPGLPDLLVQYRVGGRWHWLWAECKTPGPNENRRPPAQQKFFDWAVAEVQTWKRPEDVLAWWAGVNRPGASPPGRS